MEFLGDFIPIQNLDLEGDSEVTFDLYVALHKNQRVILYRRQGEVIENDRLEKLSLGTEVATLFVKRQDYLKFVNYVADRMARLLQVSDPSQSQWLAGGVARGMLSGTFAFEDPAMTRALMNNLNEISSLLIERVLGEVSSKGRKAYRSLLNLASHGTDFQKHPINVASLSVVMCFGTGMASKKSLADVSMAALLHDLGLAKLPPHVAAKAHEPHPDLPMDEKIRLNRHIQYTMDIIEEKKIQISPLTKLMIEQHHEYFNGQGIPNHLRGAEVNTFAQILHMADDIDHAIFGERSTNPTSDLYHLFENWSREKAFDPLLIQRIRPLFFMN